jgi:5'-deoxynucleotidase YfbR-like HD superfamily hydrolase
VHIFDIINRLNYVKRFPLMSSARPENEKHDILDTTACLVAYLAFEESNGRGVSKLEREDLLLHMLFHRTNKGLIGGFIQPLKAKDSPMKVHIDALKEQANGILSDSVPFGSSALDRAFNVPVELIARYITPIKQLVKSVKCGNECHKGNVEFQAAYEQANNTLQNIYFKHIPQFLEFHQSVYPCLKDVAEPITIDLLSSNQANRTDGLMHFVSKLDQIERWDMNPTIIKEDVKQHSADVAMFAALLATTPNAGVDVEYIISHALFHDVTECIVSDIPNNIKHINPHISGSFSKLEVLAAKQIQKVTHSSMADSAYIFMLGDKDKVAENTIVKSADMLSAYAKTIEELKLSNRYFEPIEKEIKASLKRNSESLPVLASCIEHIAGDLASHNSVDFNPQCVT